MVTAVDPGKRTADVRTVAGVSVLTRNVPWAMVHHLDEGQNALRIRASSHRRQVSLFLLRHLVLHREKMLIFQKHS